MAVSPAPAAPSVGLPVGFRFVIGAGAVVGGVVVAGVVTGGGVEVGVRVMTGGVVVVGREVVGRPGGTEET